MEEKGSMEKGSSMEEGNSMEKGSSMEKRDSMENVVLQTDGLTKSYGGFQALENVSITMREGHIYGFIGENGSGKTTLMCILTGLIPQTKGTYTLFGKKSPRELQAARRRIGSAIEGPALYPQYSAYRNLELQRILIGNPDKSVCDELLKLVGLQEVRDKKVRKFSMGMKQRLSIAMALTGRPDLLILDEPVNGLDPKNISQLRALLKKLNEEQKVTMLISSHILNELYLLASDYFIIHKGKILDSLSHRELEAKCRKYVRIRTESLPLLVTVLEKEMKLFDYKVVDDNTILVYAYTSEPQKISQTLMAHDIVVSELSIAEQSIEEYFLSVTGGAYHA